MKPSLRRDSLEKAARKESLWLVRHFIGPLNSLPKDEAECVVPRLLRFLQRHGAKVRRETLKEAADKVKNIYGGPAHTYASENSDRYQAQDETIRLAVERILSLTPRGPEKGRREK